MMKIEITVPDDWTPALTLAARQLIQRSVDHGFPIVTVVRPDATADEIKYIQDRIAALIRDAGLTAA
jgi:hypothetical protein